MKQETRLENPAAPAAPVSTTANDRIAIQESFIELVAETFSYKLGKKSLTKKMNELVKDDRAKATEKGKAITANLENLVKGEKVEESRKAILADRKAKDELAEKIKKATKPLRDEIAPLSKAIKFCEDIAIPDALKELGHEAKPVTKLSKEMDAQLAANEAKKE